MVAEYPCSFLSSSAEQTQHFAQNLALNLTANAVLCLEGDLGAGKTTFVQGIVSALVVPGQENQVQSPTFSYLNIYPGKLTVYHFDLYRLKDAEQFLEMGFEEYFFAGGICCIEWPCRIASLLHFSHIVAYLKHLSLQQRQITLNYRHTKT